MKKNPKMKRGSEGLWKWYSSWQIDLVKTIVENYVYSRGLQQLLVNQLFTLIYSAITLHSTHSHREHNSNISYIKKMLILKLIQQAIQKL